MPKVTWSYIPILGHVSAAAYRGGGEPLCTDVRCRVRMVHVDAHNRSVNGNEQRVDSYFRQLPGLPHRESCRFHVSGAVRRLVRMSSAMAADPRVVVDGVPPKVRLEIMAESFAREVPDVDHRGVRPVAIVRERSIELRTLRTAHAVLRLIARTNCDSDLQTSLHIMLDDDVVPWRQFFYGEDDLPRLVRNLRRGAVAHPVAVVVHHYRTYPGHRGHLPFLVRNTYAETPSGGGIVRSSVDLHTKEEMADRLESSRWSLVCGVPTLKPMTDWEGTRYENVRIDIRSRHQFCTYAPTKR